MNLSGRGVGVRRDTSFPFKAPGSLTGQELLDSQMSLAFFLLRPGGTVTFYSFIYIIPRFLEATKGI